MEASLAAVSKFLSLVLRHKPETIGLTLDDAGWVRIVNLLEAANAAGTKLDHDLLRRVVHENDKQRFAISGDGLSIRANQGHSVHVELGLAPATPPSILYHGTVEQSLESIKAQGLLPGQRLHVHLSADRKTAEIVGKRRGIPVILMIDAERMAADGKLFYLSENGVWLTADVPVLYIQFP